MICLCVWFQMPWTFGGTYRCFLPFTCSHFGQTRLNQNIHNTIYHSMGLALQHRVPFPRAHRSSGRCCVTAGVLELMTIAKTAVRTDHCKRLFRARNIRPESSDCFEVWSQMCPPLSDILFHMLVFTAMFLLMLPSSGCDILSWTST